MTEVSGWLVPESVALYSVLGSQFFLRERQAASDPKRKFTLMGNAANGQASPTVKTRY